MSGAVLVTGGSGGIGAEIVRKLCTAGYSVAFSYNTGVEAAERLANELSEVGARAFALHGDLGDLESIPDLVDRARAALGEFYGFVHAAGTTYDRLAAMLDMVECERVLRVNFLSMAAIIKQVLPAMSASRRGRIVAVSSVAARRGRRGNAAYSASKAAMEGYLGCLVEEVRDRGVTVNWIQPGLIDTEMTRPYPKVVQSASRRVPMGRIGQAGEVAEVARFLLSPESSYVHGAALRVDGGLSATLGLGAP